MKKTFKFIYSFAYGELPAAVYFSANNITNAMDRWKKFKLENDDRPEEIVDPEEKFECELLAIIDEEERVVWQGRETGWQLDAVR